MATRKLYYEDCHLRRFSARVLSCEECEDGYRIRLDQTAFYPEGGGQASDTGSLGGVRVLHAGEQGEEVCHLCDGALEVGETVEGIIDYDHRFDLMQQHTGEHIVSGLLHERFGCHNVGFHMGAEAVTIDFDVEIPAQVLPQIEAQANRLVWEDLPVRAWYPGREELEELAYRSKKALDWPVRIVQIPGVDSCACCGVHVARTGEVGLVKLLSCVKFRSGVRMEMLSGRRALELLNGAYEQNRLVSQAFSAKPQETGEAARRMNELLAQQKYQIGSLWERSFAMTAENCRGKGNVLLFADGLAPAQLRRLADLTAQTCGATAAVFAPGERGYAYALVSREEELGALCREMNGALSGRGGGKGGFCQGSVQASREQIEAFFGDFHKMASS